MGAFNPAGNTINVDAATIAPVGIATVANSNRANYYYIQNGGSATAFVGFGNSSGAAQSASTVPTGGGGSSSSSVPVMAGGSILVSAPRNSFVSAITSSGTAEIYVTPCYLDN